MSADELWTLLNDEYLPFRIHADYRRGTDLATLAEIFGLPLGWIAERISAASACIDANTRIQPPSFQ